jgi:phosphoglycerate dehydrogenase-like enzyme
MQKTAREREISIAVLDQFATELVEIIQAGIPLGWNLLLAPDGSPGQQQSVVSAADVVFAMWAPVTREIMEAATRLKLIQKLGAGIDRIDLDYCRRADIAVARLAGINAVAVAEHVVMFILAALRRLPESLRRIRSGEWFKEEARSFQRELRGKTVGLVGLGHVGLEVARRLTPFDVELLYFDVIRLPRSMEQDYGLRFTDLNLLVAASDIVSLHVPLNADTRHLLNEERIAAMKPEAIVVIALGAVWSTRGVG